MKATNEINRKELIVAFKISNNSHLSIDTFNKKLNDYLTLDYDYIEVDNNGDGTGRINIDEDYNTIYVKRLKDCDLEEIKLIWDDSFGYDNELSELDIKDFEILRKFNISSENVFFDNDIKNTIDAQANGIEEVDEDTYNEDDDFCYDYEEINGKYYRKNKED